MTDRNPKKPLRWHGIVVILCTLLASRVLWVSAIAYAGSLSGASVTLSNPEPSQTNVNYSFDFSVSSLNVLQAFRAAICTSPDGTCVTPTGFSAASATLVAQPVGYGAASGWVDDSVTGSLQFKDAANSIAPSGTQTFSLSGVTNPTSAGTYYARLSTYSDATYTTQVDSAAIAFVVVNAVSVSLTIDPTLTFNVAGVAASTIYKGGLSTSDRCVDSSSAVTFGTLLLPLSADTNYDCAQTLTTSTNADSGYEVSIRNLNSGNALKNIASPASIADWTGSNSTPTATPTTGSAELFGYTTSDTTLSGTANRFTTSDNLFAGLSTTDSEVAHSATSISNDSVNVGFRLRFTVLSSSGTYTGTVVYTCTPTF
ncbi:MAG: hypothetical protein ACHQUB_01840 [Candidatus Saccharimonadia bacterium]